MVLDSATAFYAVGCLLLISAGIMKWVSPDQVADFMRGLGLPSRLWIARLIGCAEIAVGTFALTVGGPVAAAAAGAVYAAFGLVVLRARVKGSPSCGCFGQVDSPPSTAHVIGNLFFAGVCLVSIGEARSPADLVVDTAAVHPTAALSLAIVACVLAGLFVVMFTALPELLQARAGGNGRVDPSRQFAIPHRHEP